MEKVGLVDGQGVGVPGLYSSRVNVDNGDAEVRSLVGNNGGRGAALESVSGRREALLEAEMAYHIARSNATNVSDLSLPLQARLRHGCGI